MLWWVYQLMEQGISTQGLQPSSLSAGRVLANTNRATAMGTSHESTTHHYYAYFKMDKSNLNKAYSAKRSQAPPIRNTSTVLNVAFHRHQMSTISPFRDNAWSNHSTLSLFEVIIRRALICVLINSLQDSAKLIYLQIAKISPDVDANQMTQS